VASSTVARRPPGRGDGDGLVVAVTRAASPAGRGVVAVLEGWVGRGISELVAVDSAPGPAPADCRAGLVWRVTDLTSPAVAKALTDVDVVVHVACPDDLEGALAVDTHRRRAAVVRSAQAVLTSAAAVGARHAVVVTSAMVFGARPGAPVPLPEDGPLSAGRDDGVVGDLLEVENVVARTRVAHPGLKLTSLRPAALVGERVDTLTTRHFEAPRLLCIRDAQTAWQFCHLEDLGSAVARIVLDELTGQLTVGCPGALTSGDVERLSGMRRVELSAALAFATAERLQRVGVLPMPATDLRFVVHPWVVSSDRLLRAGWSAAHDNEACLRFLLRHVSGRRNNPARRIDRQEPALGAAGAAVALVSTAAVWRQAKARQNRRRSGRG
jgi:nucleoside-diphosphate-sugar epimerase